jgi:hypothetical protein
MPDLLVRHLRLRIVRSGSLFWGSDPRALARSALATLPRLLAEELDRLVEEGAELEVAPPVRVHLRGSPARMAAGLDAAAPAAEVRSAVRAALAEALVSAASTRPAHHSAPRPNAAAAPALAQSALHDLLTLYASGELAARLRVMDPGLVRAYHRLLLSNSGPASTRPPRSPSAAELKEAESFLTALAAGFAHSQKPSIEERARERILAAIGLAAQVGVVPFETAVRSIIDRLLPGQELPLEMPRPIHPSAPPAILAREPATDSSVRPAPRVEGPTREASADLEVDTTVPILPLLAACMLARIGWLSQVARHLDDRGRGQDLPLWVAGLAFKLGPIPLRGWMYTKEMWQSVAAIADYPLLSGEGLVHLADHPSMRWEQLTATLLETNSVTEIDPLLASRPACALSNGPQFEEHMSRIAGWTLGRIGSALWPESGAYVRTSLERLESLDGRLTREEEGVSVRVPLGKRHSDLLRAGLLADTASAPWLRDGGSIQFYGG